MRNIANDSIIDASGSIIPASPGLALGSAASHWAEVHVDELRMDGDGVGGLYWRPSSYALRNVFDQNSVTLSWEGGVNDVYTTYMSLNVSNSHLTVGDIMPLSDGSHGIGSSSLRYTDIYGEGFNMHSGGTNACYISGASVGRLALSNNAGSISSGGGFVEFRQSTSRFMFGGVRVDDQSSVEAFYVHLAGWPRIQPMISIWPHSNSAIDLGTATLKWRDIYTDSITISSDPRLKNDINDIDSAKAKALIDNLQPKRYKLNAGESGRYHMGLLSTNLREALDASGFGSNQSGVYVKQQTDLNGNLIEDGTELVRYFELLAPMISYIQQLEARVSALESG